MVVQGNVLLAPLTTLKVGGPARYFVEAKTISEVQEAVEFARANNLPLFVLGVGSNLVVSDAGWPGLVLKIAVSGIEQREQNGKTFFDVGAGEEWDRFVARAVSANFAGVECLSGIPGSVGGTPVQNVGAYGQEVAETIHSVLALDLQDNQLHEMPAADCEFRYRTSIFNTTEKGRYLIVRVTYALTCGGKPRLGYADLKKHFVGWKETPAFSDVREAVRKIRASKGMLIVPGDDDCRSAGSFFKNPILSSDQYDHLTKAAAEKNLQVPSYPALEAQRKVSAAWLVEHSGFSKGYTSGRVGISRKHALAIVNRDQARAADVLAFKEEIQNRIEEIWGVKLEPEPVFIGF
ncbi:MAG: UDP-N-acetylmuramate dehydrogenase [Acidobacteriaceae bacterium]|nr:UDP-N-acetylmuramate dehydrogenase [Acidobacteriaceae bacterium]